MPRFPIMPTVVYLSTIISDNKQADQHRGAPTWSSGCLSRSLYYLFQKTSLYYKQSPAGCGQTVSMVLVSIVSLFNWWSIAITVTIPDWFACHRSLARSSHAGPRWPGSRCSSALFASRIQAARSAGVFLHAASLTRCPDHATNLAFPASREPGSAECRNQSPPESRPG